MNIQLLGTGCAKCKSTVALIEEVAKDNGIGIQLSKIEELRQIASFGVMSTPGVVIEGTVVHTNEQQDMIVLS